MYVYVYDFWDHSGKPSWKRVEQITLVEDLCLESLVKATPRPQHLADLVRAKGKQMQSALGTARFIDMICNYS